MLTFKDEFKRKLVHFGSSVIGFSILHFDREIILPILIISATIFPFLDYLRISNKSVSNFYYTYFSSITRSFESKKFTGATFVFVGAMLTYILFSQKVAGISLIIMSLSDAMAAIIGVRYGKTKLLNKSLEGSFAFFLTTLIILYFFKIPVIASLLASIVLTIIELVEIPNINDNLSIPISAALLLTTAGI